MADAVVEEYESSLADLTFNSKPHINMLTMLAEENVKYAPHIVRLIEAQLNKATSSEKLPVMYLMDSIVKNVGGDYCTLFSQNIVSTFCNIFEQVDEKTRMSLYKLRSTWDTIFTSKKLYALDSRVQGIDPAWPVKPLPAEMQVSTSIHVNPKFLKKQESDTAAMQQQLQEQQEQLLREQLIAKQQELLKMQQARLEMELLQTRAKLDEQTKTLHTRPQVTPQPAVPLSSFSQVATSLPTTSVPTSAARDPRLASRDPRLARQPASQPASTMPQYNTGAFPSTSMAAQSWLASGTHSPVPQPLVGGAGPLAERISANQQKRGGEPIIVPVAQPALEETSSTEKKPSQQKVQKPQEKAKTKTETKVASPKKSSTSAKDQKGKDTKSKDNKDKTKKDDSKSKPAAKTEKKDDKKKDEKKPDPKSTRGKRNYRTRRSDEDNKDDKDSKSRDSKDKKDEQKSRNEKTRSSSGSSSSRRGSRSSPDRSTRRRSTSKSSSHSPRAKSRSRSPVRRHSSRSISPKERRSSRSGRQDRTPPRSSRTAHESSKDKDDKAKAKTGDTKSKAGTKRSMEKENKSKIKKEPQEAKPGNKYEQSQEYGIGSPKFSPEPESDAEEPVPKRFRLADRDFPRRAWPLPLQSNVRQEPRARRPSISSLPRIPRKPAGTPTRRMSIDPDLKIPKELTLEKQQQILKQAEQQFRTGELTHQQYQEMLKQLHVLYELQRQRQEQMQQQDGQVNRVERREDGVRGGRMGRGRGRGLLPTPPSPWAELKRQPSVEAKSPWAEYKKSHPSERDFQFPVKEEKDGASDQAQQAYLEHRKKLEERKSYLEHKNKLRQKTPLYFERRSGQDYPYRDFPMDVDERQGASGHGRGREGPGFEGMHRRALLPYLGQQDGSPRPSDDGRREDPRLRRAEDRGAPDFRGEEDRRRWDEWKKFDDQVCKQWNFEYRKWEEEIKKWEDSGRQGARPLAPHEVYGRGKQEFDPKKEEEYRRWQDDIRRWEQDGRNGPPPPAPQESLPLGPELLERLENDRRQWEEERAKFLKELNIWEQKMERWKKFGNGPPPQRPQEPEHRGLPVDRRWEEDRQRFENELRKWDADMAMWEKNGRRGAPPLRPKEPSLPTSTPVVFMERQGFPPESQFDRPSRTWEEDHRRWEEDMRRWEQGGRKGQPPQEPLRPPQFDQPNQRLEDHRRRDHEGRKGQFERWQDDHRRWEEDMRRWEQDGRKGQPPQEPLPPLQFDKAELEAEHRRWHESRGRFEAELKKWEENGRRAPPPPSHMDMPPPLGPEMPEVARKQWTLDCQHWQDQMRGWEQGGRQGPPPSPPYHLLSQALEINDAARRQWEEDHRRWEEDMKRWEADGRRGLPPQEPVMQMPGAQQHLSALQKPEPEWREFEDKRRQWEEEMRRWEAGGRRGAPPAEPVPPRVQSPGIQNRNPQWEEDHRKWQDDMKRWELDGRRGLPPIEPIHPSNQGQQGPAAAQREWEQRHRRWQEDMRRWEADGRREMPPPEPQPPRIEEDPRREVALREWESNCRQWEEDMRRWEEGGKRGAQPIKPVLHLPQANVALIEWEAQHRRWKEDMQRWEMDGRRGVPPTEPLRPPAPDHHPDNSHQTFQDRHRMWEQDMDRWEKGGRKGQAPLEPLPPLPPKNVLSEEERKKLDEEHHMWEEAMTRWVEGGRMGPPPPAPGEQEEVPRPLIPGLSGARMGGPRMDGPGPGPRMDGPGPRMDGPGPRMDGHGPRMDGPGPGPRMDGPGPGPRMDGPGPLPRMDGPGPGPRMDGPGHRMDGPGHRMPGPGFRMDGPMQRPGQFGMMQPGLVSSAAGPIMSGPGPIMSGPMGGMPFSGPGPANVFGNMVMGVATTMQLAMGGMGMTGQPMQGRPPMQPMPGPSHMSMGPMPGIPDHHPPMGFGMAPPPAPGPSLQPAKLDVNQLFEKLLKTGIIKKVDEKKEEPKVEEKTVEAKIKKEEKTRVVVPLEERMEEDEPRAELKLDTTVPPLTLRVEDLKTRHKGVINRLYCGIQCSSCGSRFLPEETDKYANHLDWHFRMNRREKEGTGKASHRDWYYGVDDWIAYAELGDDEEVQESAFFEQPVLPTSEPGEVISCPVCTDEENDDICDICQEPFEQFWDEEEEAWHLKDAVRVNGKTYHPNCYEDYDESFLETPTPADAPKESPLEAQIKMETNAEEAAQVKEEPMDTAEEEKPSTSAMQPLSTIKEIPFLSEEAKEKTNVKEEVSENMEVGETEQVKTETPDIKVKEEPKSPVGNQCEAMVPAQVDNVTVKQEPEEENGPAQPDNDNEQTTDQIAVKQEIIDNPVQTEPPTPVSVKKEIDEENVSTVVKEESVTETAHVKVERVSPSPMEVPLVEPKVEQVDENIGQAISTIGGGTKIPVVGSASPLRGSAISVVGGGSSPARFRSNSPMRSIPVIGASSSPNRTGQSTAKSETAQKPKTGSFFKLDPSAKTK